MRGLGDTVTVFIWFLVTKNDIGFSIIKTDLQVQLQDFCLFFYYFKFHNSIKIHYSSLAHRRCEKNQFPYLPHNVTLIPINFSSIKVYASLKQSRGID